MIGTGLLAAQEAVSIEKGEWAHGNCLKQSYLHHSSEDCALFLRKVNTVKGCEICFLPWITACGMDKVRTLCSYSSQFRFRVGSVASTKCSTLFPLGLICAPRDDSVEQAHDLPWKSTQDSAEWIHLVELLGRVRGLIQNLVRNFPGD